MAAPAGYDEFIHDPMWATGAGWFEPVKQRYRDTHGGEEPKATDVGHGFFNLWCEGQTLQTISGWTGVGGSISPSASPSPSPSSSASSSPSFSPPVARGKLKLSGGGFHRDGGHVLPLFVHFGEAFSRWVRDPSLVRGQLARIAEAGADGIRFWDNLGWWWPYWANREVAFAPFQNSNGATVPATPNYYRELGRFLEACDEEGLSVHHSRGDCNGYQLAEVVQHAKHIRAVYEDAGLLHRCDLFEGNNEDWQNGGFGPSELRDIVQPFVRDTLTALSHKSEERVDLNAYQSRALYYVHGYRGGAATDRLRHIFSLGYEEPAARRGWQGEPIGPGSSVQSTSSAEELGLLAGMSWISRQVWCYMSGAGVKFDRPIDQEPGFLAPPAVRREMIAAGFRDVMAFKTLTHGGTQWARLVSPVGYYDPKTGANPAGPQRIDQAISSTGRIAAVIHGNGGNRQIAVRNTGADRLKITVLTPNDGPEGVAVDHRPDLPPGREMTVRYNVGRIILGVPV